MIKKLSAILMFILCLPILPILGAIKVKEVGASTEKWGENAARASGEFATNAEAAAESWASNTARAADTFHQAITASGMKERFRRGVQRAGAAKFARKIREVGRDRFGPGVAAAKTDYSSGVEPYFSTIAGLTLSPRKPRGDPANYNRVQEIGKALNAKRLALLGAGGG
ncbi:hypothetical protein LCGC14_0848680 [marine sediment metagenome]|uniref:Uncharacterized protein n=1 Tax=marine sediment metagenome TaxID=412755 RepID=A0A0F9PWA3_9ZZZZ